MQDIGEAEHEYLTVQEVAALLRLKDRKVYDLAASGALPCSRATGKLLFPAARVRAWIEQAQSGGATGAVGAPRPLILLGSHDPLLDWALRQSRCGLASFVDGSLDGLARFGRGEGVAAGLHVRDAATGVWNVPVVSAALAGQNAALVHFARRRRGLVFRPGAAEPRGLADLAGLRLAPRQAESGTDGLFRALAAEAGLDLSRLALAEVARTEAEAVEMVQRGEADATFGLQAVAHAHGLRFAPVIEEDFALVVDRRAWFEPGLQGLLGFCRGAAFEARAQAMTGYDISGLGAVLWNA